MIFKLLQSLRPSRSLSSSDVSTNQGFTFIELLVTVLIASGVLSGLLFLTNELLQSDQLESDRSETQRDMRNAIDYISSELREAIYVYDDECLTVQGSGADCRGLANWNLNPSLGADKTPVLAFWKLQRLPEAVITACEGVADADLASTAAPCQAGSAYTLVVYSLGINSPDLNGKAGIFRSEMTVGDLTATGYVSPVSGQQPGFRSWPCRRDPAGTGFIDCGTPTFSNPELLVDFVDDGTGDLATADLCPAGYVTTPGTPPAQSFYTCVDVNRTSQTQEEIEEAAADPSVAQRIYFGNQDVIVYLKGNASGRSGLQSPTSFLPTLESRVFIRGAIDKVP